MENTKSENIILVLDGQKMIERLKEKYGEYPVISKIGKLKKAIYEKKKNLR